MNVKKQRETKCDSCDRIFYRKLVPSKEKGGTKQLTKLNEISYWTGGKKWNGWKILCRSCLNNWFEKHSVDFADLVKEQSKQRTFHHYRHLGLLKAEKELYKQ